MTGNYSQPQTQSRSPVRGFGRMLILSMAAHLTIVWFFAASLFPAPPKDLRPLYYVDLTNLPVRDPQAGRPDARPPRQPAPSAVKAEPAKPAPVPKPEPAKPAAAKPEPPKPPPVVAKPEPAKVQPPETVKAESKKADADEVKSAIEKLREKREFEERLAALKAENSRASAAAPVEAPAGMPTGKGKDPGADEQVWIQKYLKECWNLSKYQVVRRDLRTQTLLMYNADGILADYKIVQSSGDGKFDDSVLRAILKAKQLPFTPERRIEVNVEFNLKDLLD